MFEELLVQDRELDLVGVARSGEEALDMMTALAPDVIALDQNMPGLSGLDFLDVLREQGNEVAVVLISAVAQRDTEMCHDAFAHGAAACFDKARMLADAPKLLQLLKEAGRGKIRHASHREEGTTLPNRAEIAAARA